MADPRSLAALPDDALEAALRDLGGHLALPGPGRSAGVIAADAAGGGAAAADPARLARLRIEAAGPAPRRRWTGWSVGAVREPGGRPFAWRTSRALLLALVALAALVAVAGAIGLGLPGIRIIPAGPTGVPVSPGVSGSPALPSPSASPSSSVAPSPSVLGPIGSELDLGTPVAPSDVASAVGFPVILPSEPAIGTPDTAWLRDGRLTLVWRARTGLPPLLAPRIGLVLAEFPGSIDPGYFEKILAAGTEITAVSVGGAPGWWITGEPHELVYVDPHGTPIFDSRRIVGDTLLWARGGITYRLETALGEQRALAIATSLR